MRRLIPLVSVALLSGCGSMQHDLDGKVDADLKRVDSMATAMAQQGRTTSMVVINAPYTTSRMVKRGKEAKLPTQIREQIFGLGAAGPYTIDDIANSISKRTGMSVRVIRDTVPSGGATPESTSDETGINARQAAALSYANAVAGPSAGFAGSAGRGPTLVPYIEAKFPDVLNDLADRMDFDWTVDKAGAIVISTVAQEVFAVPLLP